MDDRQALKRIVAVLLSLADLAERASARPRPILWLVLWILRPAEAVTQGYLVQAARWAALPAPSFVLPAPLAAGERAEALRLALSFRILAAAVDSLVVAGPLPCSLPRPGRGTAPGLFGATGDLARHAPECADTS